jgi:rhodanese-related sulfurtransferase
MTITSHDTVTTGVSHSIDASELRHLLAHEPYTTIVDVRTGAEFESVHIPGAFNVPLDLLAEHVGSVADLDHPVILVCQSGGRAASAKEKLNAAGKTNLRILDGGIGAWQASGGDVVRGEPKWALERQVRGVAGGIVLASIIASLRVPGARFVAGGIGAGLLFAALSDTCAMGSVLSRLPYNRGPKCDLDCVIRDITARG